MTEGEETMRGASADFIGQRAKGQDQLLPTRPVLFLFCSFLCVLACLICLIYSYYFIVKYNTIIYLEEYSCCLCLRASP